MKERLDSLVKIFVLYIISPSLKRSGPILNAKLQHFPSVSVISPDVPDYPMTRELLSRI